MRRHLLPFRRCLHFCCGDAARRPQECRPHQSPSKNSLNQTQAGKNAPFLHYNGHAEFKVAHGRNASLTPVLRTIPSGQSVTLAVNRQRRLARGNVQQHPNDHKSEQLADSLTALKE
jgi:hypothetical protein